MRDRDRELGERKLAAVEDFVKAFAGAVGGDLVLRRARLSKSGSPSPAEGEDLLDDRALRRGDRVQRAVHGEPVVIIRLAELFARGADLVDAEMAAGVGNRSARRRAPAGRA